MANHAIVYRYRGASHRSKLVTQIVAGQATRTTVKLPQGPNDVVVAYSGDINHRPSSVSITINVQANVARRQGYWTDAADGGILTLGNVQFCGSTGSVHHPEAPTCNTMRPCASPPRLCW